MDVGFHDFKDGCGKIGQEKNRRKYSGWVGEQQKTFSAERAEPKTAVREVPPLAGKDGVLK
jgi:hypothetical protein